MGRKPTKNINLPKRMRARVRGKTTYYMYDKGGKPRVEIPLGTDYLIAVQKWAELEQTSAGPVVTFKDAFDLYIQKELPSKSDRYQTDILKDRVTLIEFFDDAPLDEIAAVNIRQYLRWRAERAVQWMKERGRKVTKTTGHIRANREIATFSVVFNYAREMGLTNAPNPKQGVKMHSEKSRDVYVEDDLYQKLWEIADPPLRDALDLAYLTGQRPADVVGITDHDIRDGVLYIQQGKTTEKLRIQISPDLQQLIDRIRARRNQYKIVTTYLITNRWGKPVTTRAVSEWLRQARIKAKIGDAEFQVRDLRAKAGTDKADTAKDPREAQKQLGHKRLATTEIYLRNRRGQKVSPTR